MSSHRSLTRVLSDARRIEPPPLRLSATERRLIHELRTPTAVQRWLNDLPYNREPAGDTMRGFRGVVRTRTAHCLEAALFAATVLEQHRYPPLLLASNLSIYWTTLSTSIATAL